MTDGDPGRRRIAADVLVQVVGRFANLGLGIFVTAVLSRELGPEGFGQWATLLAVVAVVGALGDVGLEPAAVREAAARKESRREVLGALLAVRLLLALPSAAACALVCLLVAESGAMRTAGIVLSAGVATAALASLRAIFQLRVRNDVPVAVITLNSVLWAAAVGGVALGGGGLVAFAVAMVAVNTASTLVQAWLALRAERVVLRGVREHGRRLLRIGIPIGIGTILTYAYVRIDQVLVFEILGERDAGLYGAAYQLLEKAHFLPVALLTTLFPLIAAAHGTDPERVRELARRGLDYALLVGLPAVGFAVAAGEPTMRLLFGGEYVAGAEVLPALMVAFLLAAVGYVFGNLAIVTDLQARFAVVAAVALVFNVVANVLLLEPLGYGAAAWITVATELVVLAGVAPRVLRRIELRLRPGRAGRIALAAVVMTVAVRAAVEAGGGIVGAALAAGVAYPAAVLATRAITIAELRSLGPGREATS